MEPKCTADRFPGIAARRRKRRSAWRPLLVSARLINCVAFNPSPVTSLVHLFIHPVVMTHARAVCHNPPHCLAHTLSRSTRSHIVLPYLVLTLGHVCPRTTHHLVPYKKGTQILIIRKILTCNMYHDTNFRTQTRSREFTQTQSPWNGISNISSGCRSQVQR